MPYFYFNYFDVSLIKKIINSSVYYEGKYQISSEALSNLTKNGVPMNGDSLNTITLRKENGTVVSMELDITNAVNGIMGNSEKTVISIEYRNFGQVENFNVDFD